MATVRAPREGSSIAGHAASRLPSVDVDSYSATIRDEEGFVGDHASKGAFRAILEDWQKRLRKAGKDPLESKAVDKLSMKKLDTVLAEGSSEAAVLLQTAIEDFAKELVGVVQRFLKLKSWNGIERLAIGGGFRGSRIGELTIGRAALLLAEQGVKLELIPIRHDPDEAGLLGSVHLAPAWIFEGYKALLAVDIGGTNVRTGVVKHNTDLARDLSKATVWKSEIWRHADESKLKRDDAVSVLVKMLEGMIRKCRKQSIPLAPFIGVGCPGRITADGSIEHGAQNLPGNWESDRFHLPQSLSEKVGTIGKNDTHIVLHNDAVVQGLSEVPFMQDVKRWGVFTIGTGLGNACFTNRGK